MLSVGEPKVKKHNIHSNEEDSTVYDVFYTGAETL